MQAYPSPDPPAHVACIMDGNGRWAALHGRPRVDGHAAGERAVLAALDEALTCGVKWLTLFVFSTENWARAPSEIEFLMSFNEIVIKRNRERFHSRGVRVRYMGRADPRIPASLSANMKEFEKLTQNNNNITLTMAFNYGGRAEIGDMIRTALRNRVLASEISEDQLVVYTQYPDMPDVDLLIRTSGEQRLSNFMLWRVAYAELVFLDVLWPDFREEHLREAIRIYQARRRRFGAADAAGVHEISRSDA